MKSVHIQRYSGPCFPAFGLRIWALFTQCNLTNKPLSSLKILEIVTDNKT